jgi:putative acetyltransferase
MMVTAAEVRIRRFQPGDAEAFCALNEAWIEKHFTLEEKDRKTLRQPEESILNAGGEILIAVADGEVVGCCALAPVPESGVHDGGFIEFEVAKMAVREDQQRRGIGRWLLAETIEAARQKGAQRLYLESNSKLGPALAIYERAGFQHLPPGRRRTTPYQRADVQMELVL